jgi:hypothetical protein
MKDKILKYSFFLLSAAVLLLMLLQSRHAGISCDEVLHHNHSLAVYDYFNTGGKDTSALHTPETHLKYYGQSCDNLAAFIIKWAGIDDIYSFRHLMSAGAGWLTIFVAALLAIWLYGYGAGIIVMLLFLISPTFMGHAQNNLKDVPFALGYISGIYFSLRLFYSGKKIPVTETFFLIISIALAMSIRAGGMLLICYLGLLYVVHYGIRFLRKIAINRIEMIVRLLVVISVSIISFYMSIILWPFALQNPLSNVMEAFRKMSDFPSTFRLIFEGKMEWSDYMPWYYLIKSMAITIPLIISTGLFLFAVFASKIFKSGNYLKIAFIAFSVLFPVAYVMIKGSNLYSSWRQFLFIYPSIVVLSSLGFLWLYRNYLNRHGIIIKLVAGIILIFLSVHPVRYMALNTSFWYIYYNQIVGGLNGAYSNYETDYYFISHKKACEWLTDYLKEKGDTSNIIVNADYSVSWHFRKFKRVHVNYSRYEERGFSDWDYAVVTSRYLTPYQLKNRQWPPSNSIHVIYSDSVPLCAVLKRTSKDDYYGFRALSEGRKADALNYLQSAVEKDKDDEMIFFNLAAALSGNGQAEKAVSVLEEALLVNPDSEPVLMYLGNLAVSGKRYNEAEEYYKRLLNINRKYFEAYVELARLVEPRDRNAARDLLRQCLTINPGFKPAMIALADTYRSTDPEIAVKFDEMARMIK